MRKINIHEFDKVFRILQENFPADEYRDYSEQKKLLEDDRYSIHVVGDESIIGFISLWEFDTFIFIEHFAVSQSFRKQGIGTALLKSLCENTEKQLILEVELPENDTAERRITFYERNGFFLNDYTYEQPAYSETKLPVPLLIMSYGEKITAERFDEIKQSVYKEVYKK